jgi:hypothetical protein
MRVCNAEAVVRAVVPRYKWQDLSEAQREKIFRLGPEASKHIMERGDTLDGLTMRDVYDSIGEQFQQRMTAASRNVVPDKKVIDSVDKFLSNKDVGFAGDWVKTAWSKGKAFNAEELEVAARGFSHAVNTANDSALLKLVEKGDEAALATLVQAQNDIVALRAALEGAGSEVGRALRYIQNIQKAQQENKLINSVFGVGPC